MKYEYKVLSIMLACAIFTHILHLGARHSHISGGTLIAIIVCGAVVIGILHSFIPDKPNDKRNRPPDQ